MHELISSRWSPRGFDPDATLTDDELVEILDAGRWAATWGRIQPVRFVVGTRPGSGASGRNHDRPGSVAGGRNYDSTQTFDRLAATLNPGNAGWAARASALILVCTTDTPDDPKPHEYGAFDAGLAVAQMSLQAVASGFATHPIAGFDGHAAATEFAVPQGYRPLVIVAIGTVVDDASTLPADIRDRDEQPRTRLPLQEVAFTSRWGTPFRP